MINKFLRTAAVFCACGLTADVRGAFDLQYTVTNPGAFTPNQLALLNAGLAQAEAMWETVISGYQAGISVTSVPISVSGGTSGLASASFGNTINQGGFVVATTGFINININEIENFASWQGAGANGLNFIDELMAHETGHVLGVGTLWSSNGVYINNTFQYTGQHGLAAYRAEFDPLATFVPVENAGNPGTPNAHWDQRMRSSTQEGNPANPFSLDPRVGVTDRFGRDRALEVMTGAIDPDYLEPFLSLTTVQSMRDMGYSVRNFGDFNSDGVVQVADLDILDAHLGATGMQIDSVRYGDFDRDRDIDAIDRQLLRAEIPEPTAAAPILAASALALVRRRRR